MKTKLCVFLVALIAVFSINLIGAMESPAEDLPELVSITTFKVGSLGYTITSAFREAVENYTPMKIRVESYGTEVARFLPLKKGDSEFTLSPGPNAVCASYGLGIFASKNWGPQPIRIVWRGMTFNVGCFVWADSGINSLADLKGKRVPRIPGSEAYNTNVTSHLAFAGLTWKDVTPVICSSMMGVLDTFLAGKLDVVYIANTIPKLHEVFGAKNGCKWLDMPKRDVEGWKRLQEIAPWNRPRECSKGIGMKTGESITMGSFPYTIYAYEHARSDVVYEFVKGMAMGYDIYSKMHKVLPQWTLKQAVSDPSPIPYHPGAIKYYKEAGVWGSEMEKWQAAQLKSYEKRAAAWKNEN